MKIFEAIEILQSAGKTLKKESESSINEFKDQVVDVLSKFDEFDGKIWRNDGKYITVILRNVEFENAEEIGNRMARALNRVIPDYKAELVSVGKTKGWHAYFWSADIKFEKN